MVTSAPSARTGQNPSPPRRHARAWRMVLAMAFVGACSFALWQGVVFFQNAGLPTAPVAGPAGPAGDDLPVATTRPGEGLTGRAMAYAELEPLDGDPGRLVPPPGATRRLCRQFLQGGFRRQEGAYDYRGTAASAEEHYRKALPAAGFAPVGDWGALPAWRTLAFARGGEAATVSLRSSRQDARIVSIVVVVSVPVR
ncbi:MAG: hypothetical protein NTV86_14720 [Planctomycetota bacterium]|nr:hypothetical protein [Planctomycetota bacterium]